MNLGAVGRLAPQPETGMWYRAADIGYLTSAIATGHTIRIPTRFYDPAIPGRRHRSLYLSDDRLVAQFEAGALFGSPTVGGWVSALVGTWIVLSARVQLARVVDLSSSGEQMLLDTTAQELTGDWRSYRLRSARTMVPAPVGSAPTQELGEAIFQDRRKLEGLLTVSAKIATNRNSVVFPESLGSSSYVEYDWTDATGAAHTFRIDRSNKNGTQIR